MTTAGVRLKVDHTLDPLIRRTGCPLADEFLFTPRSWQISQHSAKRAGFNHGRPFQDQPGSDHAAPLCLALASGRRDGIPAPHP